MAYRTGKLQPNIYLCIIFMNRFQSIPLHIILSMVTTHSEGWGPAVKLELTMITMQVSIGDLATVIGM